MSTLLRNATVGLHFGHQCETLRTNTRLPSSKAAADCHMRNATCHNCLLVRSWLQRRLPLSVSSFVCLWIAFLWPNCIYLQSLRSCTCWALDGLAIGYTERIWTKFFPCGSDTTRSRDCFKYRCILRPLQWVLFTGDEWREGSIRQFLSVRCNCYMNWFQKDVIFQNFAQDKQLSLGNIIRPYICF